MTGVLQLGPFLIRTDWLYYGLSILLGLAIARKLILKKSPEDLRHLESFTGALLIGILLWKVSPIFTEPQILKKPLTLLLYPGTSLGITLAYIGAALYLIYTVWKKKYNWRASLDVFTIVVICSVLIYTLTHWQYGLQTTLPWGISISDPEYRYHPINAYQLMLIAPLIWYLFRLPIGQGKIASNWSLGFGVIILCLSLLKPKMSSWLNLSTDQWLAIVLIAIGFLVTHINAFKSHVNKRSCVRK
ncbi:prolipoprotein diacylglyceryl transferase family protein [Paenibacillus sp. MMO-177]|uniref:prolipoprotein diacylglyceryl transferase family protein n=1 Tax=Paenibacillus sp. MMO-177 TaxID=3081289 RepID=UPI003019CF3E